MRRRIFGEAAGGPPPKKAERLGFPQLPPTCPSNSSSGDAGLTDRLLRDWALGKITSKQIQDYCEGSVVSGCDDDAVSAFANLGAHGKAANNIQRDLMRKLKQPVGAPPITFVRCPMLDGDRRKCIRDVPILLPHLQFDALQSQRPDFFDEHVRGTDADRRECWGILQRQNFVQYHPILKNCPGAGVVDRFTPIGLHGDAGSVARKQSIYVLSWNSLSWGGYRENAT